MADADAGVHTCQAMELVNDESVSRSDAAGAGRAALSRLPGFVTGDRTRLRGDAGDGPGRMAVCDRRAAAALRTLDAPLASSPGHYRRFMQIIDDLLPALPADA